MKVCSICGEKYEGFGNNAQPVNKGRCCDKCNSTVVVPTRIAQSIINEGGKKDA